jgi:hypothetical protein
MNDRPKSTRRQPPGKLRLQTGADVAAARVLREANGICARCGTYGGARKAVDRGELQAECFDTVECSRRFRLLVAAEAEAGE